MTDCFTYYGHHYYLRIPLHLLRLSEKARFPGRGDGAHSQHGLVDYHSAIRWLTFPYFVLLELDKDRVCQQFGWMIVTATFNTTLLATKTDITSRDDSFTTAFDFPHPSVITSSHLGLT
jgi:hypothetical protein